MLLNENTIRWPGPLFLERSYDVFAMGMLRSAVDLTKPTGDAELFSRIDPVHLALPTPGRIAQSSHKLKVIVNWGAATFSGLWWG